jgi:hypothetical protein
MKSLSPRLTALLLVLSVFVASCSDLAPTAPESRTVQLAPNDSAQLLGTLWSGLRGTLLTCSPMPAATATATIGQLGGVINVGPHRLVVPPGALSGPVTITATAPSSTTNRVEFQPHGLQFARPAALTMSYANCGTLARLLPKRIAYVDGQLNILEFLLSVDVLWQLKVSARLDHFSEYAVAW